MRFGAALAGAAALVLLPPIQPAWADKAGELRKIAERSLPFAGDAAAVARLKDGQLLLVHHPEVLKKERISPGSVVKLITSYALLQQGRQDASHDCRGSDIDAFGQTRACWLRSGHGTLRLLSALAASCNVWFYRETARTLDAPRLLTVMREFGLGAPWAAGAGVVTDELPLSVTPADLPDLAIGDHPELMVTPLSLLRMVSVIATRGSRLTFAKSGARQFEQSPLDPALLGLVALAMEEAARGGTMKGTFGTLSVAAKSGTAKRHGGSGTRGVVLGFFPRVRPHWVFVVVKDRGRGAKDAGPAAAAIAAALSSEGHP